jgi:uncharacterized protein
MDSSPEPELPAEEPAPDDVLAEEAAGDAPVEEAVAPAGDVTPEEGAEREAPPVAAGEPAPGKPRAKRAPKKPAKAGRPRPRIEVEKPRLDPALRAQAVEAAFGRLAALWKDGFPGARAAVELLESGKSLVFVARFRKPETWGMDERRLRALRDEWQEILEEEEARVRLREVLRTHGGLTPEAEERLQAARSVHAMEDIAAPYLPVTASRAIVARGMGLEALADAIRKAAEGSLLAELAKPFVKEGGQPPSLDAALGGARDILAEEICLDAELRGRLRELFRKEGVLTVSLRPERKGDAGRHASLVGFQAPPYKIPPMKFLAIRRGERERVLATVIEPPDEKALPILHAKACAENHPHAGFLRAAAEDGYRRILKPMLQAQVRDDLKARSDRQVMDNFERNLRNLLLGPLGGSRRTLGLRPDVTMGHRWCAVDEAGVPTGFGQLPHEPTAGREACLTELKEILKRYEIAVVAVGAGGGRGEAMSLAKEACESLEEKPEPLFVSDGGTKALESLGKLTFDDRPDLPSEMRGACSLARRFQNPLAELAALEPKSLNLGPHLNDVHQGRLRTLLEETVQSCVAHAGVDAERVGPEMLARVPGFKRASAEAFVAWRKENGPLPSKAALAAVPGVGPEVAEQAVGFLRLPSAEDPRDRTQLHPEQYGLVDRMAAQVKADVAALCADGRLRSQVHLADLQGDDAPLPLLKTVLYQLTAGHRDPRPVHGAPIEPPPGITLQTLRPGLWLQGRVTRAVPFGVFVDVGLDIEALIPMPHIGDRPGVDPATVAPQGAVINARVLEVDVEKKRLALTMRPERFADRDPRFRGGGRGPRREGPPRGPAREPRGAPPEAAVPVGAGAAPPAAPPPPRGDRGDRGERRDRGDRRGGDRDRERHGGGRPRQFSAAATPDDRPGHGGGGGGGRSSGGPRKGKFGGGGFSMFGDRGHFRDEPGTPRTISIKPDEKPLDSDDKELTPEQLLAKKLAELQKKLGGGR